MPRPVPRLIRALSVLAACGSLSACVAASGQPYGTSYFSAQVYSTPAYRGGYYGPGYGRYVAPRYYGPGSGSGYGRYYAPSRGYYGPGSGTGLGYRWR